MNKLLALSVALSVAVPAVAQQPVQPPDPTEAYNADLQNFINEYNAGAVSAGHLAQRIGPLVTSFKAMSDQVKSSEVQKATLIEWLKAAQAKEAKQ